MHPGARHFRPVGGDLYHLETRFNAYPEERIYGLGQHQHGLLDQKGAVIDLLQRNSEVCIPFLLSSRNYGFLWNNPAVGRVELGTNATRWVAEATPQLDYWITAGDGPAADHGALRRRDRPSAPLARVGGRVSGSASSATGPRKSCCRSPASTGGAVSPSRSSSSTSCTGTLQGDWQFDPQFWPDPAAMVSELEAMGVKAMVSIWPTVNALSESFDEMQDRGWLVGTARGTPAHMSFVDTRPEGPVYMHFYDATHPEARRYVWERCAEGYYRHGVKLFWLDADEPEMYPMDPDNLRYHLGDGRAVTNIYPLLHAQGFYEGMRTEGEDRDPHPQPLGLGRQPALRRGRLVGRRRLYL